MDVIVACSVQARFRVGVEEVVVAEVDDDRGKVRIPSGLHRHCPGTACRDSSSSRRYAQATIGVG